MTKTPIFPKLVSILALLGSTAIADDITKTGTGTDLSSAASWSAGTPGPGDTAVWDGSSLGAGLSLNSASSWGGIRIEDALSDIDISGAGTLTLGTTGINATGSGTALTISNAITLAGNQIWSPGTELILDGPVSGSSDLTLTGSSGSSQSYNSFLTTSATVVFANTSLADLTSVDALMDGGWVNGSNAPANAYKIVNDGITANFQLRFFNGGYTKGVKVELAQSGPDITARVLYSKYLQPQNTNNLNFDFDTGGTSAPIATNAGQSGYGVATLNAEFGADTLVTFAAAGSMTGDVAIHSGRAIVRNNTALGSANLILGPGDASLYLGNRVDVGNDITVNPTGGTAIIGADNSGSGANPATLTGTLTLNRPTTLSGEVFGDRFAVDGRITGDVGTLTIAGGSRTTLRSTANDFTGNIVVSGPGTTLQASVNSASEVIPDSASLTVETGARFLLASSGNGPETINALNGAGEVATFPDTGLGSTLVIGAANGSGSFDGSLNNGINPLAITKTGTGTQVFAATANYSGPTHLNAGTLIINGDHSSSASTVTVASGTTLGGTGTLGGPIIAAAGSIVAPGNPGGTLGVGGGSTINGNLNIEINGTTADRLSVAGTVDVSGMILNFTELSPPLLTSYTLVSATSIIGSPAATTGIPAGFQVNVEADRITLSQTGVPGTPKASLLFVHAHPDDETIFGGGVLPYYAQVRDLPVAVLSMVTRNPNGSDPLTSGATSRIDELRRAMDTYAGQALSSGTLDGADYQTGNIAHVTAGFIDTGCCSVPPDDTWSDAGDGFGWGTSSGVSQLSPGLGNLDGFSNARLAARWAIARQIRRFRPEIIVTPHDLEGDYGHSNHTATSIAVIEAWDLAADPGTDINGLAPWQAKKLYLRGGPQDNRDTISYFFSDPNFPSNFASEGPVNTMFHDFFEDPIINGQSSRQVADDGLNQHASQGSPDVSTVFRSNENFNNHHSEWWTLYRSNVGPDDIEADFTVAGDTTGTTYSGWARGDFFDNLTVFPDRDEDGLPDAWELAWFPNLAVADPAKDGDGDGLRNRDEFIAGLNPVTPDAPDFTINPATNTADFTLPAASAPGYEFLTRRYQLLFSPDLHDWSTIVTEGTADGTPLAIPITPGLHHAFYRLAIRIE